MPNLVFTLEVTLADPVISVDSFNDVNDTGTLQTNRPNDGNFVWATIASGSGSSLGADGSGGWTGGTPLESGTVAVGSTDDNIEFPYTATTGDGTRDFVIYQRTAGGTDSNVRVVAFTADSTAPTLSNVSVIETTNQLVVSWETNTGDGQARVIAVADGQTVPSAVQAFAGTDGSDVAAASDSGLITVTASGTQVPVVLGGLSNGSTYDVYVVHRDGHRNLSSVSTVADQVPAASSGYTQIVEDTFTRSADETLTDAALWTEIYNATTITPDVVSATGLLTIDSSSGVVNFDTAAWLCEVTLDDDQWSEFTYTSVAGVNRGIGLLVRATDTAGFFDGYRLFYQDDGGTPTVKWFKHSDGEFGTQLDTVSQTLSVGDRIRARASGTSTVTLEAEINTGAGWTSLLSTTDSSSPIASGKSGLWATSRSQGSTISITRFAAGNWA